jgi:hypothetical protein
MSDKTPTFAGELLFAGYSDSSRSGPRVTFRLADRDELERFIGKEGKRYACVLMEIADDETPASPTPAPAPRASATRERMAPLCEWAVMICRDQQFRRWALGAGATEDQVKAHILTLCGIESRKELDTDPAAAKKLHDLVRKPYAAWLERQGVPA